MTSSSDPAAAMPSESSIQELYKTCFKQETRKIPTSNLKSIQRFFSLFFLRLIQHNNVALAHPVHDVLMQRVDKMHQLLLE